LTNSENGTPGRPLADRGSLRQIRSLNSSSGPSKESVKVCSFTAIEQPFDRNVPVYYPIAWPSKRTRTTRARRFEPESCPACKNQDVVGIPVAEQIRRQSQVAGERSS
jgi:hypothetical protein